MGSQTILIVDDTPANLKVLFTLLSEAGFQVAIAESGEMALDILEMIEPQLILLDIMMPGLSGIETCQQLKAKPQTAHIPVIFLSALSDSMNKVEAFKAGAVDYITKPIGTGETLARVNQHLALKQAQVELALLNQELEQRVADRTTELMREVSERRQVEAQFRSIFEWAPIGMAVTDDQGQFIEVNKSLCETLGYSNSQLMLLGWSQLMHPDSLTQLQEAYCQATSQGCQANFKLDCRFLTQADEEIHGILQAVVVKGNEGQPVHLLCQLMDITHRKLAEAQLHHTAHHDALTGLPNRVLICQRLDQALARSHQQPDHCFALLFLDLDRFKLVNDSLGHQVGDQLLMEISRRLETVVRDSDTIGRLGGDEFVVLLNNIATIDDAVQVANRINAVLKKPFYLSGHTLFSSASIGIAQGGAHYRNADELLRNADIAMYSAKAKGREGDYIIFDNGMYEQVSSKLQLEIELRDALENCQFQLYYQPIVALDSRKLLGFEALLRWFSPTRGVVSPSEFIPIAEETGLIIPLGEWILETAIAQLIQWRQLCPQAAQLKISINLSILQLKSPSFLQRFDALLTQLGWQGPGLQLEITESIFMEDLEGLLKLLQAIKQRGIELALDDFGTGYSCLSYLQRFPLDHLKIDRAFVSGIGPEGQNSEIAATVIHLAHQLGMTAVAEGIEMEHQLKFLASLGCQAAQGYWFAKPLNRESAEKMLLDQRYSEVQAKVF